MTRWENIPAVLGVLEVAKILNISRNTAYNLFSREDFPARRIGRNFRISGTLFGAGWKRKGKNKNRPVAGERNYHEDYNIFGRYRQCPSACPAGTPEGGGGTSGQGDRERRGSVQRDRGGIPVDGRSAGISGHTPRPGRFFPGGGGP